MRTIEYRVEELPFSEHFESHIKEVLERLSELGRDGWEVASVDLTQHPGYSPAAEPHMPVPVLLQRAAE
ncbi:MAG TPA: hypothetical protein VLA90_09130 [Actinomycetota bacterium]|nr:hypothetical protein [Actinomycetota bacterium]